MLEKKYKNIERYKKYMTLFDNPFFKKHDFYNYIIDNVEVVKLHTLNNLFISIFIKESGGCWIYEGICGEINPFIEKFYKEKIKLMTNILK